MNRRQEIAAWAIGAALSLVSWWSGAESEQWFAEYFMPILIMGALAIYSLRSRTLINANQEWRTQHSRIAERRTSTALGIAIILLVVVGAASAVFWDRQTTRSQEQEAGNPYDDLERRAALVPIARDAGSDAPSHNRGF